MKINKKQNSLNFWAKCSTAAEAFASLFETQERENNAKMSLNC